jgi:hypothetical protein
LHVSLLLCSICSLITSRQPHISFPNQSPFGSTQPALFADKPHEYLTSPTTQHRTRCPKQSSCTYQEGEHGGSPRSGDGSERFARLAWQTAWSKHQQPRAARGIEEVHCPADHSVQVSVIMSVCLHAPCCCQDEPWLQRSIAHLSAPLQLSLHI